MRSSSAIVLSHLTRNILISTQETLIFWGNGLFNGSALQWRHNERDGISTHQPHDCLLNRLLGCIWNKTSKLRVTGLCEGNSPLTGEFPAQRASNSAGDKPLSEPMMVRLRTHICVTRPQWVNEEPACLEMVWNSYHLMTIFGYWCLSRTPGLLQGNGFYH